MVLQSRHLYCSVQDAYVRLGGNQRTVVVRDTFNVDVHVVTLVNVILLPPMLIGNGYKLEPLVDVQSINAVPALAA